MLLLNFTLLSPKWIWTYLDVSSSKVWRERDIHQLSSWLKTNTLLLSFGMSIVLGSCIGFFIRSLPIEKINGCDWIWGCVAGGIVFKVARTVPSSLLTWHWIQKGVGLVGICICLWWGGHHLKQTHFGFDYYRMWGGDLKRRGSFQDAVEKYQKANSYKDQGPARFYALGQLQWKLGLQQEALVAYEEAANRWSLEMKTRLNALKKDSQNTQVRIDFQKGAKQLKRIYQELLRTFQTLGYVDQYQAVSMAFKSEWDTLQEGFTLLRL